MKKPDLQDTIVAFLRTAGGPISSRELASRFLLIRHGDESTCHRLLAPLLAGHPALEYRCSEGWFCRREDPKAPAAGPAAPGEDPVIRPHPTGRGHGHEAPLGDFVALAADGAGPSGSGRLRVVSLQPVLAGEECGPEHLPAWAAGDAAPEPGTASPPGHERTARTETTGLGTADLRILVETVGDLPIVCHRVAREVGPLLRACAAASLPFHPITISLSRLGRVLLGLKARHTPSELAAVLGLDAVEPDDCRGRVRLMSRCFLALLPLLEEVGVTTFAGLQALQDRPAAPLDFSPYAFTADDLRAVPASPGVYRFRDRAGETIYIGKAKNLRARLSSYFDPSARGTGRGRAILEQVHSFSYEIAASELEALLNEAALLAESRPPLNRQFDVHERPAPYGPRLNLAVLLPESTASAGAPEACTVHLLQQGRYRRRIRGVSSPRREAGARRKQWNLLDGAIRAIYFRPRGDGDPAPDAGEVDWQLVASYLARNRDDVNVLDVDECDSPETALARLRVLAEAAIGGERAVAR